MYDLGNSSLTPVLYRQSVNDSDRKLLRGSQLVMQLLGRRRRKPRESSRVTHLADSPCSSAIIAFASLTRFPRTALRARPRRSLACRRRSSPTTESASPSHVVCGSGDRTAHSRVVSPFARGRRPFPRPLVPDTTLSCGRRVGRPQGPRDDWSLAVLRR